MFAVSQLTGFGALPLTIYPSIRFDGDTILKKGSDLSGVSDGKVGTFSCWIKADWDGQFTIWANSTRSQGASQSGGIDLIFLGSVFGYLRISGRNAAGTKILELRSDVTYSSLVGTMNHIMGSWDLGAAAAHLYVNDVEALAAAPTLTDDSIDYTRGAFAVGGHIDLIDALRLEGCLCQFYLNTAEYVDLSNSSNRAKFYSPANTTVFPRFSVDLGVDGSTPTGTAPAVFLNNQLEAWGANLGTGGNLATAVGGLSGCG